MTFLLVLAFCYGADSPPVDIDKLVETARAKDFAGPAEEAVRLWEQVTAANPYQGQYWLRLAAARKSANQLAPAAAAYAEAHRLGAGVKGSVAYSVASCH